jgi:hypothetical protein
LAFAEMGKDVAGMEWAAGKLLGQDWPVDNQELQLKAQVRLDALAGVLEREKRAGDADRLRKTSQRLRQRDLVVRLTWEDGVSGPCDLDLEVTEPGGSICSWKQRQSTGGGIHLGDSLSELNRESYIAAQGFKGEYEIKVNRVWGRPLGSRARVEIILYQGTPQEDRRVEVVDVGAPVTLKVDLTDGRRTEGVAVPPMTYTRPVPREDPVPGSHVLERLRDLASGEFTGFGNSMRGAAGSATGAGVDRTRPSHRYKTGGKEETAFQTEVSPFFNNSANVNVQAIVSADRRYVRLNVNASFRMISRVNAVPVIFNTGIPGGMP